MHEFRIITAESILKNFDGEVTIQVLASLRITENRLLRKEGKMENADERIAELESNFPRLRNSGLTFVNDTEWEIL